VRLTLAEAAALLGDRPHALAKAGIVSPGRLVSHGHAAAADGFTRPPRSSRMPLADGRQLSASPRASPLLSQEVLQRRVVQHGIGQQPLQPRVLVLQRPQPLGLGDPIPPNLAFHL
jgi:hypothetical protein